MYLLCVLVGLGCIQTGCSPKDETGKLTKKTSILPDSSQKKVHWITYDDLNKSSARHKTSFRPDIINPDTIKFVDYDEAPLVVSMIKPIYSKDNKINGTVVLNVFVTDKGKIAKIMLVKSLQAGKGNLDEAAIEAVKQWTFMPGKVNGKQVNTSAIIPVKFD